MLVISTNGTDAIIPNRFKNKTMTHHFSKQDMWKKWPHNIPMIGDASTCSVSLLGKVFTGEIVVVGSDSLVAFFNRGLCSSMSVMILSRHIGQYIVDSSVFIYSITFDFVLLHYAIALFCE
jgi:hypothetical protein